MLFTNILPASSYVYTLRRFVDALTCNVVNIAHFIDKFSRNMYRILIGSIVQDIAFNAA